MNIYNPPKYCTYLTIYFGDKLPAFYIGSTSIGKIKNKYHGSVKSKKYGLIWNQELKENPYLFKTIILEKFYSRKNATYNERLLQRRFNVVKSTQFINMAIAKPNGFFGMDCSGKNSPVYGRRFLNKSKPIIVNKIYYPSVLDALNNLGLRSSQLKRFISSGLSIEEFKLTIPKYGQSMTGKKHSEEAKLKISKNKLGKPWKPKNIEELSYKRRKNSSGRIWINNTKINSEKFILFQELNFYIDNGWKRGRIGKKIPQTI